LTALDRIEAQGSKLVSQTQTTTTVEKTGAEAVQSLGSQATSTEDASQQTEQVTQDQQVQDNTTQEPKEGTPEWATKRFSELTSQREEQKRLAEDAARERDFYKKLALERQGQPSADHAAPKTDELVEPKLEDFTDYSDFLKSSVDYRVKLELRNFSSQIKQNQTKEDRARKFYSSAETFKKETPDFEATITSPTFVQSESVVEAVLHSNKGPQVAYFLAKNPAVTSKLNSLSPFEVALEIGRIEERLTPPQPKVVTQSPKPLHNVSGTGETVTKDPEKMNMEEYAKHREPAYAWRGKKAR
jgi:hypothetical protein